MLIDQVPPPRPRRLPDVIPGPPAIDADSDAEWERYADEDGRSWWRCSGTGRHFMEGAPGAWSKYVDEGGRLWWWHDDEAWFFADTGCRWWRVRTSNNAWVAGLLARRPPVGDASVNPPTI